MTNTALETTALSSGKTAYSGVLPSNSVDQHGEKESRWSFVPAVNPSLSPGIPLDFAADTSTGSAEESDIAVVPACEKDPSFTARD